MRRFFNARQKIALFLAAGGKCEGCGEKLARGWHADHHEPWARGGETDVLNGQALCPKCNQAKGNAMLRGLAEWPETCTLRQWQRQCFERYVEQAPNRADFFLVATPGAGKTIAAGRILHDLLFRRVAERVVIVVPTRPLCKQWADALHKIGIELDPNWQNQTLVESAQYHGMAVTYQQVASNPDLHRRLCKRSTAVIFDEVHHAGDDLSWGSCIRSAFEFAAFRLSMSGTPFRSDNNSIPFIPYEDGLSRADFGYSYANALTDNVCRSVMFPSYEGRMEWYANGETITATFGDEVNDAQSGQRLRTALDPRGEWLPKVIQEANNRLTQIRTDGHGDAGFLLLAIDQNHAKSLAPLLTRITGDVPLLSISDLPEADANIEAFRDGRQRWLIAVKKVSEGVDIPRLRGVVYATNVISDLFFRQAVGRVVRVIDGIEEQCAYFWIPKDKRLFEFAQQIMSERDHQLREEIERSRRRLEDSDDRQPISSLFLPIGSEAYADDAVMTGELLSQQELHHAERVGQMAGVRAPLGEIALILRAHASLNSDTAAQRKPHVVVLSPGDTVGEKPDYMRLKELKGLVNRLAGRCADLIGCEYVDIHGEWLRRGGKAHGEATIHDMEMKRDWLMGLIEQRERTG